MAESATLVNLSEPVFDPSLGEFGEFVATALTGQEVFGLTWTECAIRLSGANECAIEHAVHNDPMGLLCELGPCAKCDPFTVGKCDWKGYDGAGD